MSLSPEWYPVGTAIKDPRPTPCELSIFNMYYLNLKTTDPSYNLAVEEYVFQSLPKDHGYFMLWQNDNAIIIGKHQNTLAEINEGFVRNNDIKVVRRLSGGGAVYHDLGNLNFTFITDAGGKNSLDFKLFCQPLVETLADFGIEAEITGRNDVTIDGKKFSGNAQYVKKGRVMHHGTIMFDSNLSVVAQALKVDPDKIKSKGVQSTKSRVTNVSEYLKGEFADTPLEEFRRAFLQKIVSKNGAEEYVLTEEDKLAIEKLKDERYGTWDWNYGKSPAGTMVRKSYIDGCGLIEAYLTIKDGRLEALEFKGDFFSYAEPEELAEALRGTKQNKDAYVETLKNIDISKYFHGLTEESFIDFIFDEDRG